MGINEVNMSVTDKIIFVGSFFILMNWGVRVTNATFEFLF